ncbi:hypothetical protein QUA70_19790 [Microcoleus sp. LAD1_D5]|uniref:hypothetical protein n=1 Tax=Microcoleus sp. LAD1_D5 TaxID=2818813 RepID=UPI002FD3934A
MTRRTQSPEIRSIAITGDVIKVSHLKLKAFSTFIPNLLVIIHTIPILEHPLRSINHPFFKIF